MRAGSRLLNASTHAAVAAATEADASLAAGRLAMLVDGTLGDTLGAASGADATPVGEAATTWRGGSYSSGRLAGRAFVRPRYALPSRASSGWMVTQSRCG